MRLIHAYRQIQKAKVYDLMVIIHTTATYRKHCAITPNTPVTLELNIRGN